MAVIRDFTITTDTLTDRTISLRNEQIARTLTIGSSWTKLRLGMLVCISSSANVTITDTTTAFGLTAGTSSLAGDISTTHFVGFYGTASLVGPNQVAGQLWTQQQVNAAVKVGSTLTQYGDSGASMYWGRDSNGSAQAVPLVMYIDYIKAATDPGLWIIKVWFNDPAQGNPTITGINDFYSNITQATSSITSINHYSSSVLLVPVSESAHGYLDSINVYWQPSVQALQPMEIATYRFA